MYLPKKKKAGSAGPGNTGKVGRARPRPTLLQKKKTHHNTAGVWWGATYRPARRWRGATKKNRTRTRTRKSDRNRKRGNRNRGSVRCSSALPCYANALPCYASARAAPELWQQLQQHGGRRTKSGSGSSTRPPPAGASVPGRVRRAAAAVCARQVVAEDLVH